VTEVTIAGIAQTPYARHPPPTLTTHALLAQATADALADAGVAAAAVDGLAVSSFSLAPDHAIDLAWRLGLRLRWLLEDTNGGASGVDMLAHAVTALRAGKASMILIVAGDAQGPAAIADRQAAFNRATRDHLAPIGYGGPNSLFAMLTQRQMRATGLKREDYGRVVIAQRAWAASNPDAVYRTPLTLEEYLAAPPIADPLARFDCVPGVAPADVDLACVYDDYPAIVLAQLCDAGLAPPGDLPAYVREVLAPRRFPVNTSGGLLSCGQAGAAGGLHGLVEAVRQLRHDAGERQVPDARLALVGGYGMVLYRHGAAAAATVLERVGAR
jgi:acetyl-CoA acetyltransferase